MKVMFQGAHSSNNGITEACCVAAIMSAAKYNRKTLILQLTGSGGIDAEKFMVGKDMDEELQTNDANEVYRINDKGIDALIRRAATAKLTKDHFDSSCKPLLEYANMLDIAGMSKKADFVENITVKEIRIILKYADDVYDNVFLILDGKNQLVMQEILELSDVYVTCLSQTPRKESFNTFEAKRMLHLVTNYDNTSAYSALYLKKLYKARKIFLLRQNTEFKDSCMEGTLLRFMLKNVNNTNGDDNYAFMKNVTELMDGIMDKENWEEEVPEAKALDPEDLPKEDEPDPLYQVTKKQVTEEKVLVKEGFFKKKKKRNRVKIHEDNPPVEENRSKKKKSMPVIPVTEDTEEREMNPQSSTVDENDKDKNGDLSQDEEKAGTGHGSPKIKFKPVASKIPVQNMAPTDSVKMQPAAVPAAPQKADEQLWTCPKCGDNNDKLYCATCGAKKPSSETWICPDCGTVNTERFCECCGTKKP